MMKLKILQQIDLKRLDTDSVDGLEELQDLKINKKLKI
jgi:hypothetical protein